MKKVIFILGLVSVLFFASCVDEDKRLGLEFVGDNNAVNVLAADLNLVHLEAQIFNDDTLKTKTYRSVPLGSYRDNNFGRITTSIYTPIAMSSSYQNFSELGTADSIVLTLAYSGFFAKNNSVTSMDMRVVVNELTETIDSTKTHANDSVSYNQTPIFDANVNINVYDTNMIVGTDSTKYNPHLRLKLSNEFLAKITSSSYESGEAFAEDFKGFRIQATNTDANGMIAYVDLSSSISGVTLYYTTQSGMHNRYTFTFPTSGNTFVHVDKDYSNTPLAGLSSSLSTNAIATGEYMYLAALGVAEIKLNILGLDTWYSIDSIKDAAINRAELILPVADISGDRFTYPNSVICYRKPTDTTSVFLRDEIIATNIGGETYFDTTINAYRILVTSHLQNYLKGNYSDPTIYIIPDPTVNSAARVVLNGPNFTDPTKRPKLNIIYSHPTNK